MERRMLRFAQVQNEFTQIKSTNFKKSTNIKPLSDETDNDSVFSHCHSQESTNYEIEDSLSRCRGEMRINIDG